MLPGVDFSDEDCIGDYKMRCDQRTTFPGASAFDFSAIFNIVIADILGWDEKKRCPFPYGGAFGDIDGFSGAVEEQGRKTLHAHMLVFIKALSEMLLALQKNAPGTVRHILLKTKLRKYIDNIMSTRLHRNPIKCQVSFKHECSTRFGAPPQPVKPEVLRANRHKRGCVAIQGAITTCPKCDLKHSSEGHMLKRLRTICPAITCFPDTSHRLEILIMRHIYTYLLCTNEAQKEDCEFLINAFFNLHRSLHAKSCFKYGLECRYLLPALSAGCSSIIVHEGSVCWFNIMGVRESYFPITSELKREVTDVFMNTYNRAATIAIGSNTNVNTGEIRTVFYCTTYSSKNTQEDDQESFKRVIDTFIRRTAKKRRELEAMGIEGGEELDDAREGFKNIYVGILANTQAHVISATLAHYIVCHGSRFRYSHDFVFIPVSQYEHYFRNVAIWTPLQRSRSGTFFMGSNIVNYVMRPTELESACNLVFFVEYQNAKLSALLLDNGEYFPYPERHPLKESHCIIHRDEAVPILPEIPFCLLPDLAKVGPIFPPQGHVLPAAQNCIRERYAMYVNFLLFPFRSLDDIKEGMSKVRSFFCCLT